MNLPERSTFISGNCSTCCSVSLSFNEFNCSKSFSLLLTRSEPCTIGIKFGINCCSFEFSMFEEFSSDICVVLSTKQMKNFNAVKTQIFARYYLILIPSVSAINSNISEISSNIGGIDVSTISSSLTANGTIWSNVSVPDSKNCQYPFTTNSNIPLTMTIVICSHRS